jgi:threonine/homoserine/homoserine lactone efflux protein
VSQLLLQGLIIGFSIAAPVGPMGLLCIKRAVTDGPRAGFICGLGAATADGSYALLGAFAMTGLERWLIQEKRWLALGGGLFLIYLGVRTMATGSAEPAAASSRGAMAAYGSALALTLANPMTILSFAGAFAALGLLATASYPAAGMLVGGVFAGSALWWFLLSAIAGRARGYVSATLMQIINRACGAVIGAFGCYAIAGAASAIAWR